MEDILCVEMTSHESQKYSYVVEFLHFDFRY